MERITKKPVPQNFELKQKKGMEVLIVYCIMPLDRQIIFLTSSILKIPEIRGWQITVVWAVCGAV